MASAPYAIEAQGLCKLYDDKVAVDGLDLCVEKGEVFGFLGPNGAGKTTFVKMLLGLVHPTSGSARLCGQSITVPEARRRVGFLPEHFSFHEWMKGAEFLDLHGRLGGISAPIRRQRAQELLDLVGLGDASHRRLGTYSKGMLQRIGLAQALICSPDLVFLDEPTSGLDPLGRRMVRRVLAQLREQGVTVFLNSHLLSEVESTCTRVAFIQDGRVVSTKSLTERQSLMAGLEVRISSLPDALLQRLKALTIELCVEKSETDVLLTLGTQADPAEIARCIIAHGVDLYSLTPRMLSLEELFVREMEDNGQ